MDGRALTALALCGLVAGRAAMGSRGVVRRGSNGPGTERAARYLLEVVVGPSGNHQKVWNAVEKWLETQSLVLAHENASGAKAAARFHVWLMPSNFSQMEHEVESWLWTNAIGSRWALARSISSTEAAEQAARGSQGLVRRGHKARGEGYFRVPIEFRREASDDREYIEERMKKGNLTRSQAAIEQLAAELDEAEVPQSKLLHVTATETDGTYKISGDIWLPMKKMRWPMDSMTKAEAGVLILNNYFNRPHYSLTGFFTVTGEPVFVWDL